MNEKIILQAEQIYKMYSNPFGQNKNIVLSGYDLSISQGESVGIVGPSGSGKSTIARVLLQLISIDSGKVLYKGRDISRFNKEEKKEFRKKVQFIAQRPEVFFDPRIKFYKSIKEAVFLLRKNFDYEGELRELMQSLDLSMGLLERYPHQISGGEIQRLAICRALLVQPEVIIFDEATSMLDVSTQAKIIKLLGKIKKQRALTYLFISHDRALIQKICDRVIIIR